MRCTLLACLAVALVLSGATGAPGRQTASLGALQGVVLRGETDQPVANGSIRLARPQYPTLSTTTDNLGRFVFKDLAPGEWRMILESNGYVRRLVPDSGTSLKVDGNQSLNLTIRLTPTGAVSGRLIDRSGQPVGDVPVRLLDETNVQEVIVRSNDRGDYRFYFVTPGKYRLTAGGTTTGPVRPNSAATRFAEEFDFVYYPGGNDRAFAQIFDVKAGEEVSGMNMVMGEGHAPAVRPVNTPPAVAQPRNEALPQSPRVQ
jgi:hypothetical protein